MVELVITVWIICSLAMIVYYERHPQEKPTPKATYWGQIIGVGLFAAAIVAGLGAAFS